VKGIIVNMENQEFLLNVKNIISEISGIDIELINENQSLYDDLEIDSLELENIIILIEEQYNIDISNEEYENLDTINDLLNIIMKNDKNK